MAHIALAPDLPGIIGLLTAYPHSRKPLNELANAVLVGDASLTRAEREMIAAYTSHGNSCRFCTASHAAAARHLLRGTSHLMDDVMRDAPSAAVGEKMRALLAISDKTRRDGRLVTESDIQRAKDAGADDRAIHDTVLITAMFCMFNRYVDGLGTSLPEDATVFDVVGARIAEHGYGSQFKDDAGS
jgi:uncharacterized peroxidase-related enzyme